jgi:transcriptional regulator with PAS, ATPase and Fis domain
MPLDLQPVLLRVLDEKRVMRVGASQYVPVDFRLITATNRNLAELVAKDKFRTDLLYRLKVLQINIPPLRERGQDIILLANHFLRTIAEQQKMEVPIISDLTMITLLSYDWPGNVRQLENAMLYALNISSNGIIEPEHLPEEMQPAIPKRARHVSEKDNLSMKEVEKIFIAEALQQYRNNISEAAASLKMSRSTLYRKIKEYDLKIKQGS